jgi:hypothetical protein
VTVQHTTALCFGICFFLPASSPFAAFCYRLQLFI